MANGSKRTKRFDEGGGVEEMKKGIASNQTYSAPEYEKAEEKDLGSTKTTRQRFNEAFAKNKGGGKSFEFEGKMYSTAIKGAAKPAAKSVDENEGVAERRMAAIGDKFKADRSSTRTASQASPTTKSESSRIDEVSAPGTKVGEASKVAAVRPKDKPVAPARVEPHFGRMKDVSPPERLTYKDSKRLTGPRGGTGGGGGGGSGGVGGGSRNLMLGSELDPKALMREIRAPRDDDDSRFADEGNPNYKRGGKVKKMASGGKTRSASSRADGCAIRGKTRA